MNKLCLSLILLGISSLHAMEKSDGEKRNRRKSTPAMSASIPIPESKSKSSEDLQRTKTLRKQRSSTSALENIFASGKVPGLSQSVPEDSSNPFLPITAASPPDGSLTVRLRDPDILKQLKQEENGSDDFDRIVEQMLDPTLETNSTSDDPQLEFEALLDKPENAQVALAYWKMKSKQSQKTDHVAALYRALYKKLCEIANSSSGMNSPTSNDLEFKHLEGVIADEAELTRKRLEDCTMAKATIFLKKEIGVMKNEIGGAKESNLRADVKEMREQLRNFTTVLNTINEKLPLSRDSKRSSLMPRKKD